jgi:hypothetical protein
MAISDTIAAFLAFGLLHLRGYHKYAGWRWLFLIEVRHVQYPLWSIVLTRKL